MHYGAAFATFGEEYQRKNAQDEVKHNKKNNAKAKNNSSTDGRATSTVKNKIDDSGKGNEAKNKAKDLGILKV